MRDAGVVGFFDGVRGVGPGVAALVALVGDQAVADHDEQSPLGRLSEQPAGQVAQRRAEPGVSAGGQAEAAGRHEAAVVEVLEAVDLDAMPGVAGEDEDAVPLAGQRHRSGQRVGTGQLELEDPCRRARRATSCRREAARW